MAAVLILIFGEVAGFEIVPFIATHVKMIFFSWSYEKHFSANQNSPICMKTTDIKLSTDRIDCGKVHYTKTINLIPIDFLILTL